MRCTIGVGIDPDEYELIFKGGYQGRRTRAAYRPGEGLGLRLAKRVIERHNGQTSVSSVDQKSAFLNTFTLFLPYVQPPIIEEEAHGCSTKEGNRLD
jgi:signal transduction histidine kinase